MFAVPIFEAFGQEGGSPFSSPNLKPVVNVAAPDVDSARLNCWKPVKPAPS